jgi:hypothetical protein
MKQIIKNYGFNAGAKSVTFTDFATISLDRILLITNVSSNTVIYQFNDTNLGGSVSGNVLTLTKDTSAMSNSNKLQVIYDCASGDPLYDASSVSSTVQGTVAAGTTDSGNPVKVGGRYSAAGVTLADGQRGDMQLDAAGRAITSLGTKLAGEDLTNDVMKVEQRFNYRNISTNATTTVKSSGGFLHSLTVSTAGASTTATLYDSITGTGTKIATIATTVETTLLYDVAFTTGLTIVTAGTTAGDMTVSYR